MNPISPSITVVIPTYNRGAAIYKTIESALHQDLPADEFEIIVVDDGSTDDTFAVLEAAYAHNPRVRLFSTPNGGVARARNFGLEQARGEFIAYLDHDDLWLPQKLRLQREAFHLRPKVGVVYCDWRVVDEGGLELSAQHQQSIESWWKAKEGDVSSWILLPHINQFPRNPITSMTIPMIRTQSLRDIGGFDETTVPSDDWDAWIRLSFRVHFAFVPEVLAYYVHHNAQQHRNADKSVKSWIVVCKKSRPYIKRKPYIFWRLWRMEIAWESIGSYKAAKGKLFDKNYYGALSQISKTIFFEPWLIFSKAWIYLLWRVGTRNPAPY